MRKKQYFIHSSYRLNSNLATIKRKTLKSYVKTIGEVFNPLTNILAKNADGSYYVIVEWDKIILQTYQNRIREGDKSHD